MRKTKAILIASFMLALAAVAHAEAPQSQFGFTGWPYRNQPACQTQRPSMGSEATPLPTVAPGNHPAATPQPSVATPAPQQPTKAPIATTRPSPTATPKPIETQKPSTGHDYTTDSTLAQEQITLNLVNSERKANGLSDLILDQELCRLARIKCADMRDNHYFAHESPTYGRVGNMLTTFGYSYTAAGENIAHHATAERAHVAFMSSDGHRRNILSSAWTKIGIGVCYDENGFVYVTEIFVR